MVGLYVHIPFCKQKCFYCDFFSIKYNSELADKYIDSLIKHAKQFKPRKINSIYIGGGTPSILSLEQIQKLLQNLSSTFNLSEIKEFTFELNPESASKEKLHILKTLGVNRLSIGLQSPDDRNLEYLGSVHDFKIFCHVYDMAMSEGFDNLNIDLIYGLSNQTVKEWEETLQRTLLFKSTHLSLYPLTVEENTPFYAKGVTTDDDLQRRMYDKAVEILQNNGYIHYEISNWAKKSKESFHNSNYWRNLEYIGLGAGASGYLDRNRYKNIENVEKYIDFVENKIDCRVENEYINEKIYKTERIMLGLRLLCEGLSIEYFKSLENQNVLSEYLKEKMLLKDTDTIKLSPEQVFTFNQILSKII
jgi:oxygen-independent coproporphyrinogen-3 oxidase